MIVAAIEPSALETLSRLHGQAFAQRWSAESISVLLASPGVFGLAADATDAFLLARVAADEAEILTLAVAPELRRQGHASALVRSAADKSLEMGAKAMFLEVDTTNEAARALYAKLGFRKVGERRGYYRDNASEPARDALTLKAELPLGKATENG